MEGRSDKMEMLYNYLSGSEFRRRIEGIAEAFTTMQDDLAAEKRAMMKLWSKREKQLEKQHEDQLAAIRRELEEEVRLRIEEAEVEMALAFSTHPIRRQVLGRDVMAHLVVGLRERALELWLSPDG